MTDVTEYIKGYMETLPNGFLYMVRMYIFQLIEVKINQQKKKDTGKGYSLIRKLSKWLPVLPSQRIYIKVNTSTESSDNSSSSHPSIISQIKASDGLNSIRTLFNTIPDGCICWRSGVNAVQNKSLCLVNLERKTSSLPPKEHSLQSESYNFTFVVPGPRASTPLSFIDSAAISSNSCAMAKITQLEEELASLRKQIASIAAMQGSSNVHCHSNNDVLPQFPLLPPPPPPPPPPLRPVSIGPTVSLKDSIQQSKLKKNNPIKCEETEICSQLKDNAKLLPHMSDVLKGMHTVKLRPVERSPGGTPIRRPALPSVSQDPVSLLTAALQRRFAKIHPHEISPEKENRQSFDSPSPTENGSPFSVKTKPFGQHLLKPSKKSLKPLAPLTQINL